MWKFCIGVFLCLGYLNAHAQDRNHFNYILYCQGCHTADGAGAKNAVPKLKDQIGYFLQVDGGREYLVQVPGAATSVLNDKDLAALLNWMLTIFGGDSVSGNSKPFTANEVATLRKTPLLDTDSRRKVLKASIEDELKVKFQ